VEGVKNDGEMRRQGDKIIRESKRVKGSVRQKERLEA